MDALDQFTHGILAMRDGFAAANIDIDKVSIQISERDGMMLEHLFTQKTDLVRTEHHDPRYSKPKADNMVREFQIAGVKIWYRNKPYITPSGAIL